MRSNIAPGGARPDYELPDHAQTIRKLSELQADDPLILTLARPQLPEGPPAASSTTATGSGAARPSTISVATCAN
jgi:hypothetical protein